MNFICVVLAGGEGRRMGGAKPQQPYGGRTLLDHALTLARGYADEVVVAVRDRSQVGPVSANLILDDPAIEGPLAAVAAALDFACSQGASGVLTLPCDAPLLPADLASRLAEALTQSPRAHAAVAVSGGQWRPDCALWRVSARERLPAYVARGARSLGGFAEACNAVAVEWAASPADLFTNANTQDQLAALQPPARP